MSIEDSSTSPFDSQASTAPLDEYETTPVSQGEFRDLETNIRIQIQDVLQQIARIEHGFQLQETNMQQVMALLLALQQPAPAVTTGTPTAAPAPTPIKWSSPSAVSKSAATQPTAPTATPTTAVTTVITYDMSDWKIADKDFANRISSPAHIFVLADVITYMQCYNHATLTTQGNKTLQHPAKHLPPTVLEDMIRLLDDAGQTLYDVAVPNFFKMLVSRYAPRDPHEITSQLRQLKVRRRLPTPTKDAYFGHLINATEQYLYMIVAFYTHVPDSLLPPFKSSGSSDLVVSDTLIYIMNDAFHAAGYDKFKDTCRGISIPKTTRKAQVTLFKKLYIEYLESTRLHASAVDVHDYTPPKVSQPAHSIQPGRHAHNVHFASDTESPVIESPTIPITEADHVPLLDTTDTDNHELHAFTAAGTKKDQICFTAANSPDGTCDKHARGACPYIHDKTAIMEYRKTWAAKLLSFNT